MRTKVLKVIAMAGATITMLVGGLFAVNADNNTTNDRNPVAYVLGVQSADAYQFTTGSGLVIEDADVTKTSSDVGVGITSYLQIFKYLGLTILIGVTSVIVNKVFGFVKIGG